MSVENGIRILVTGGTFDKEYDELSGALFFRDTHLPEMLALGRAELPYEITTVMMIDSLDMTDDLREQILNQCLEAQEEQIIITHGTDTMVQTATLLGQRVQGKTVVLTGAMVPYKFGSSDGMFNLGCAVAFAQALPHGVYVTMNGRYFPWNDVRKNTARGRFERLNERSA
jgi:L-asparaginase